MTPKPPSNLYPITIIGAGITGLSTAYHLHKLGIGPVKLYEDPLKQAVSKHNPAYVIGGCWDNFTRISHVKGGESAALFWGFGDRAFDELRLFCLQNKLPWTQGRRLRLICSEQEQQEARQAVKELEQQGFKEAHLWSKQHTQGFSPRVLEVQEDGQGAGAIDVGKVLQFLRNSIESQGTVLEASKVWSLNIQSNQLGLNLANKEVDQTEMLVLASHLEIGNLLPDLQEAVIPVADQWSEFSIKKTSLPPSIQGKTTFLSAHHGYEWAVSHGGGKLLGGGCRYLRKQAGIGDSKPAFDLKIESKNSQQFASWFEQGPLKTIRSGSSACEIYPCDETPLIGPMFGTERIVLATGFMHLGLSYGFFAGKCLAELIHTGYCNTLPRLFWPERLRSL